MEEDVVIPCELHSLFSRLTRELVDKDADGTESDFHKDSVFLQKGIIADENNTYVSMHRQQDPFRLMPDLLTLTSHYLSQSRSKVTEERVQTTRAPVSHNTFMYWVMTTCDPQSELIVQDCLEYRQRQQTVNAYKQYLFNEMASHHDFLDSIDHLVLCALHSPRDDGRATKPTQASVRRALEYVRESALGAMRAPDFDMQMHESILHILAKHLRLCIVIERRGGWEEDSRSNGVREQTYGAQYADVKLLRLGVSRTGKFFRCQNRTQQS